MKKKLYTKNRLDRFFLNSQFSILNSQKGAAMITLLFFTLIATTVTSAAVVILLVNSLSGTKFQQGSIAYEIAQSGIDNAKLRLLRDPDYSGETLPVGSGTAVITVTRTGSEYIISSRGTLGNFVREIQLQASYSANLFDARTQQEIF